MRINALHTALVVRGASLHRPSRKLLVSDETALFPLPDQMVASRLLPRCLKSLPLLAGAVIFPAELSSPGAGNYQAGS